MPIDLDVVVDVDARFLPIGVVVSLGGQGFECRSVQRFELAAARAGKFFEGSVVELHQQGADRRVEVG